MYTQVVYTFIYSHKYIALWKYSSLLFCYISLSTLSTIYIDYQVLASILFQKCRLSFFFWGKASLIRWYTCILLNKNNELLLLVPTRYKRYVKKICFLVSKNNTTFWINLSSSDPKNAFANLPFAFMQWGDIFSYIVSVVRIVK